MARKREILRSLRAARWHFCGGNVCLFVKSESFDTFGPHTCPGAINCFLEKKSKNTFQPSAFCHLLTCQPVKTLLGLLGFSSLVDKHPHLRHLNGVEKTGLQICGGMKGVFERIFWQNILFGWESLFSVKGDAANQIEAQKPVVLIADFQYYCRKILVKS